MLYEEWFAAYDLSPTLVIETDRVDYIEHLFDRLELVEAIRKHVGPLPGKEYTLKTSDTRVEDAGAPEHAPAKGAVR